MTTSGRGLLLVLVFLLQQPSAGTATAAEAAEERCLALTLYWEAKGEGRDGMLGVAMVVLNRLKSPSFPDTICDVVREGGDKPGCQFSYWCDGKSDEPKDSASWELSRKIAREVLAAPPRSDPTRGALYYHVVTLAQSWDPPHERTVEIGNHVYYR
jgi:N-acetylmuramoyl-L-alanine amidase